MIRTWGRRSAPLVLFTVGFLTLGSGVASADIAIGPVSVPTEAVDVSVASGSGSNAQRGRSDGSGGGSSSAASAADSSGRSASGGSSSDAPGAAASTQAAPLLQVPQQEEGGVLSGNTINGPNVNANICGTTINVAGNSSANCGGGAVPPPDGPPEEVPPPDGPEEVPAPDEPPSLERPGPEGAEMQAAGEQLPVTGFDASSLLALAVGLLMAGVACLAASSHRIRLGRK